MWRAVLLSAAIGAGCAWWVMDNRIELAQARHEAKLQSIANQASSRALEAVAANNERIGAAVALFAQESTQANENARKLQGAITALSSDTRGLRQHVADLPGHWSAVSASTAERYASTCSRLLAGLGERGEGMAKRGAGIAKAAQGHFADDALKARSWPAPSAPASHHP